MSGFNCIKLGICIQKDENIVMYTIGKVKTLFFVVQNPLSFFKKCKKVEKNAFKKSKNSNYEKTCKNFCRIFGVQIRSWLKFFQKNFFRAP